MRPIAGLNRFCPSGALICRSALRAMAALLVAGALGGCALPALSPLAADLPPPVLADAAFARPAEAVTADDLFTLSPEMQAMLGPWQRQVRMRQAPDEGLVEALHDPRKLQLAYDAGATLTAAEAFASRRGNCLTLAVLTATFAKALGLPIEVRLARFAGDDWERNGPLLQHADHVQLAIGTTPGGERRVRGRQLVIDFAPPQQAAALYSQPIDEAMLAAMFLNNRAVERLAAGRTEAAYWWARAAVLHQPQWLAARNTLAAVYLRAGRPELAEPTLAPVLARAPQMRSALGNQVQALAALGRHEESLVLRARLFVLDRGPADAEREQAKLAWLRAHASGGAALPAPGL